MISCFYVSLDVLLDCSLEIRPGVLLSSVFVRNVIRLIERTHACGSKMDFLSSLTKRPI